MDEAVVASVRKAKDIGLKQYVEFVEQRIAINQHPLSDTITKNNLLLFASNPAKTGSKSKAQISLLKRDCQLFSRLYISCQSRDGDLDQFFAHENQSEPPSLSLQGQLRHSTKSDFVSCFEATYTSSECQTGIGMMY